MDINTLENLRKKKEEQLRKFKEADQQDKEELSADLETANKEKEALAKLPYPEETEVAKRLLSMVGRDVVVEAYCLGNKIISDVHPLKIVNDSILFNLNENQLSKLEDRGFNIDRIDREPSFPLYEDNIGKNKNFVVRIIDAKTGEELFSNPYANSKEAVPKYEKIAAVLGKKYAEREIDGEIRCCESLIANLPYDYNARSARKCAKTLKELDQLPQLIEQGKKYIYPQKFEQWEACACDYAYRDEIDQFKIVLEIMGLLDEFYVSDNLKKAVNRFDDEWDRFKYDLLYCTPLTTIARFSKNGELYFIKVHDNYGGNLSDNEEEFLREIGIENEPLRMQEYNINKNR